MKTLFITTMAIMIIFMGCIQTGSASKPESGELPSESTEATKPDYTFNGKVDVAQFFTDDYDKVEVEMMSETTALVYVFGRDVIPTVAVIGVVFSEDGFSAFAYCYLNGINELKNYILEVDGDKVHYAEFELDPETHKNFKEKLSELYKEYMKQ